MLLGDTVNVPLVPWLPDQPPLPVHTVAFLLDHLSVALAPAVMVVVLAVNVTLGGVGVGVGVVTVTRTDALAAPPLPAQERM